MRSDAGLAAMTLSIFDVAVHFGLEATGSLIAIAAYKTHRCSTGWHRLVIWLLLTLATTILTVALVG